MNSFYGWVRQAGTLLHFNLSWPPRRWAALTVAFFVGAIVLPQVALAERDLVFVHCVASDDDIHAKSRDVSAGIGENIIVGCPPPEVEEALSFNDFGDDIDRNEHIISFDGALRTRV